MQSMKNMATGCSLVLVHFGVQRDMRPCSLKCSVGCTAGAIGPFPPGEIYVVCVYTYACAC